MLHGQDADNSNTQHAGTEKAPLHVGNLFPLNAQI